MAAILLIIDGMTDDKTSVLQGRTPFEFAQCSNLISMRSQGAYGLLHTCPERFQAESMTCILTILGLSPEHLPVHARAYFEAVARGISVKADDLVLRCNLVSVDSDGILQSACAQGISAEQVMQATLQASELLSSRGMEFYPLGGYKNLITVKNSAKEAEAMTTFAPHEHCGQAIADLLPLGTPTARRLAEFAQLSAKKLQNQSGQSCMLLPWGQAHRQQIPSFFNLHHKSAAAVCATEIVRGMAQCMGLYTPEIQGATADVDTDLNAKALAAIHLSKEFSFVLIHINGADEAAHRRNPRQKAEFLKRIDTLLIGRLMQETDAKILVCSDHATVSQSGKHRGDPQPFILYRSQYTGDLGSIDGTHAVDLL